MTLSDNTPDADLWPAWAAGDRRSGKVLVNRHYEGVEEYFRSKLDKHRAKDLTSATFLAAQEGIRSFRGDCSFRAWLFGIARNKLRKHLREHYRDRRRFDPEADSVADLDPSPVTLLNARQQRRLLTAALRRLPLEIQEMLELHYWENMSIAEIAVLVGKPEGTVKTRMRSGRQRLEDLMEELKESAEEFDSTRSGLEGWAKRIRLECAED